LAACALVAPTARGRALAYGGALVLAPLLLLADIWDSPQLHLVHRHPLLALAAGIAAVLVLIAAAVGLARHPGLLGPLAVAALPFRVPIQAGGTTSNLLVPLYLVVAAGSLALIGRSFREPPDDRYEQGAGWVRSLLAVYVVVYALQAVYSPDFEKALQQMVFFYVPFALLFGLLTKLDWTARLVRTCFVVVVVLALIFACIGFIEYSTKTILLNPKLVVANDLHTYFTVNSVFFDPDIFGRFLALVMIGLAALLLFERRSTAEADGAQMRMLFAAVAALAVLWCGLVLTLSRSSLGALLLGLAILAALRWRLSRALIVAGVVIALGALAVAASPKTFGLNQGLNGASSGRASLVTGGLDLFGERPGWGYGSGSFVHEYRRHHPTSSQTLSASHTIPITIAAEQGVIGELVYLALVVAALATLLRGAREDPRRAAIGAAFAALVFHTLLYADFLEDPVTWALLAVGCALAAHPLPAAERTAARLTPNAAPVAA
jgi:putative inorganic carbon (hco3(-)) transporter